MSTPAEQVDVAVIGGGLAGMAAAAALAGSGFRVELLEARPYLGGRAASYELPGNGGHIDNCQHVLLGCCTNLLDLYERMGASRLIRFHDRIPFVTPGGRMSVIEAGRGRGGRAPAPLHLLGSLLRFHALSWRDKLSIAAGMTALAFEAGMRGRASLDRETMIEWLRGHAQTRGAIEHFWRVVLTSALNEDLERVSAWHGIQVFWKGFLAHRDAWRVGTPAAPLSELYAAGPPGVGVRLRARVRSLAGADTGAGGEPRRVVAACLGEGTAVAARWFVVALPFENLPELLPECAPALEHSPIVGVHLWFDRPVLREPFAALLGRTIQWAFRRPGDDGYLQCVISAARNLVSLSRNEIIDLAVRELHEFFPGAGAQLLRGTVVKELRATYSAAAGVDGARPAPETSFENCFLAGDWVQCGWPATMEGAVRSGYLAAERVAAAAGRPRRYLKPDLPPEGLSRWAPAARQ